MALRAYCCSLALLTSAGCAARLTNQAEQQQSGSIGVAYGNGLLFVADPDNDGVAVVDPTAFSGALSFVPTGTRPERLIVRGDDVFVANRFARTVTQISAATQQIVQQIAVGAEPMGLEVSGDARTLYVAEAMSQQVRAVEIQSGKTRWTTSLADEVRAVAVLPDGRLFLPGYKSGMLHVVDGGTGKLLSVSAMNQPPAKTLASPPVPTSVEDIHVDGNGNVVLAHSQSAATALDPNLTTPVNVGGLYAALRFIVPGCTTLQPDGSPGGGVFAAFPDGTTNPPSIAGPFAGPKASALDPSGNFIYVVNYLSGNVALVPVEGSGPPTKATPTVPSGGASVTLIGVGGGPNGIALSHDSTTAYVYNSFDHSISVISAFKGPLAVQQTITGITPLTLTPSQQNGRLLFHNAADPILSQQSAGGVACASCHPNGREDGVTWSFAEGLRNTPSLVGKRIKNTAPYHWDGAFTDFAGLDHVVQSRMGGTGLSDSQFADIINYLSNEPGPDNPFRSMDGTLTSQQQQGQTLFTGTAGCVKCHSGSALTDNNFWDVGTGFVTIPLATFSIDSVVSSTDRVPTNPNTPSLLGIFASAPYLHDGSAPTLESRIRSDPSGKHGQVGGLSGDEVAALVAYLQTL